MRWASATSVHRSSKVGRGPRSSRPAAGLGRAGSRRREASRGRRRLPGAGRISFSGSRFAVGNPICPAASIPLAPPNPALCRAARASAASSTGSPSASSSRMRVELTSPVVHRHLGNDRDREARAADPSRSACASSPRGRGRSGSRSRRRPRSGRCACGGTRARRSRRSVRENSRVKGSTITTSTAASSRSSSFCSSVVSRPGALSGSQDLPRMRIEGVDDGFATEIVRPARRPCAGWPGGRGGSRRSSPP